MKIKNKTQLWWALMCFINLLSLGTILYNTWNFSNVKFLSYLTSCSFWLLKICHIFIPILPYFMARVSKKREGLNVPVDVIERGDSLEDLRTEAKMRFKALTEEMSLLRGKNTIKQRLRMKELVEDLFMFSIFFITLNVLVLGTRDAGVFYSTKMVENTFVTTRNQEFDLYAVNDQSKLLRYFNETLLRNIHQGKLFSRF